LSGNLEEAVQQLKRELGKGLVGEGREAPAGVGGAEIDRKARDRGASQASGPTLFAELSKLVDLRLVSRLEFGSGAVAMRYEPRR